MFVFPPATVKALWRHWVLAAASLTLVPALLGEPASPGYTIAEEVRQDPRPLKIYVLKIDLYHPGNELAIAMPDDPDGDGPAEAKLVKPTTLAKLAGFDIAVNASPWTIKRLPMAKRSATLKAVIAMYMVLL